MTRRSKKEPEEPEDAPVPPERQIFAANLIRLRQERGLTQTQLSEASGINQSHISKLERAAWDPRLSTILALARALDIAPSELLPVLSQNKWLLADL